MPLSARYASSPEGQPAAAKREAIPCDNHPDKVGTPAMGRQLGKSQKAQACPKAGQNRSRHRSVSAEGHCTAARHTLFSLDRARPISLLARPKGAPAAPRAVGRGGARERAQFSPQAETELSGLCDDDNGGRIPRGSGPLREQNPPWPPFGGPNHLRAVDRRPYIPPGSSSAIESPPAEASLTPPVG